MGFPGEPPHTRRVIPQHGDESLACCINDEFGSSYSTLGYLRNVPFDVLKIDKQITVGPEQAPADPELLKAVISLGRSLSLGVVAEGIEYADRIELLRMLGDEQRPHGRRRTRSTA